MQQLERKLHANNHLDYEQRLAYTGACLDMGAHPDDLLRHMAAVWKGTLPFMSEHGSLVRGRDKMAKDFVDGPDAETPILRHFRTCRGIIKDTLEKGTDKAVVSCPYVVHADVQAEEELSMKAFRSRCLCSRAYAGERGQQQFRAHGHVAGFAMRMRVRAAEAALQRGAGGEAPMDIEKPHV